ncbi:MAG: hypothetical protein GQ577_04160 [Woeseiaceae bacterium]|nr:hypothetical protein [Woeseiaceae bacterium]
MTDARDPGLQAMFDTAREDTADEAFVARVMADVEKGQRRTVISWVFAGLLLAPVAWWLSTPLLGAVDLATQLLPDTLVAVEGQWLAQLFAPVNSVAGIAGLSFLVAWALYRKISS